MDKYIIYGVFFLSMLCFPAYFYLQFRKNKQEREEQQKQIAQEEDCNINEDKYNC